MDPYSRRTTWEAIRAHKEGRTIVLTTHFMEEASGMMTCAACCWVFWWTHARPQCVGGGVTVTH